jgi:hypothetical protein
MISVPLYPAAARWSHCLYTKKPGSISTVSGFVRKSLAETTLPRGGTVGSSRGQKGQMEKYLLRRSDVYSTRAFFTAFHLELDGVTFLQAVEVEVLESAAMEKYLLTFR